MQIDDNKIKEVLAEHEAWEDSKTVTKVLEKLGIDIEVEKEKISEEERITTQLKFLMRSSLENFFSNHVESVQGWNYNNIHVWTRKLGKGFKEFCLLLDAEFKTELKTIIDLGVEQLRTQLYNRIDSHLTHPTK